CGGTLCHEGPIAFHEHLFFTWMGTACHKQLLRLLKPKIRPCPSPPGHGWYRLVELYIPCSSNSRGLCSQRNDTIDIPVRLHQAAAEGLQHRPIERSHGRPLLPRKGPGREPTVHQSRRHSTPAQMP